MAQGLLSLPLRWNRRIAVSAGRFFAVVFLFMFFFYIGRAIWLMGTLDYAPSYIGDQTDYDLIDVRISKMRGFGRNIDDPDYLAAYKEVGLDTTLRTSYFSAGYTVPSVTTTRPPALPFLIAMARWTFGRQFWAIRTLNAAFMAAAVALGGVFCLRAIGWVPALLCLVLLWCPAGILKSDLNDFSTDLLTENLACLCVTTMACWMQSLAPRSSPWSWAGVGVVAGLAVLTRTSFALWLPGLVILTHLLVRSRLVSVLFFASALIVVLPWFARNYVVLHAFMPLGAQGSIDLPAAFSDAAVEHGGLWFPHSAFPKPEGPYQTLLTPGRISGAGVLGFR
jgi:hypothetical protein